MFLSLLGLLSCGMYVYGTQSNIPKCKIRCGIVNSEASHTSWLEIISAAWAEMTQDDNINGVEFQFVPITKRSKLTMDDLIGVYMEMGTSNVTAIIGPHVAAIGTASQKFNIPYFMTTSAPYIFQRPSNIITVLPSSTEVVQVLVELIQRYGWKSIGVVFDSNFGVRLVEEMTGVPSLYTRSWRIGKRANEQDIRQHLLVARQWGVRHFILAVSPKRIDDVMTQALRLSMLTYTYSWIVALLTQEGVDLQPYAYTQVNLTTLRLVRGDFNSLHQASLRSSVFEYATVWDTLLTLYHAIRAHYDYAGNCHWTGKYIPVILRKLQVNYKSATGDLTFYPTGQRKGYNLDILSLDDQGLYKIGHWNASYAKKEDKLVLYGVKNVTRSPVDYLSRKTIRVVTMLNPPFVQFKAGHYTTIANNLEGYCIDLLNAISANLRFNYELYLATDGKIGSKLKDGTWDGIIAEILLGNASMAVASATIDAQRETVVDFAKPFMTYGISMVMKKPREQSYIFQFMYPLSPVIWYLLLGALVFPSITLYILDRVFRLEDNPARYDASESVWFVFASLVRISTEVIPRTLATRVLAASIWFFALILVCSYTANLAAFLTVKTIQSPIDSMADLMGQTKVKYGTVKGSHIGAFFQNSKIEHFQKMWTFMSAIHKESMVDSPEEGYKRVKESNGDYAFLWNSQEIRYRTTQDCDLIQVGQPIHSYSYGIAIPLGAPYRDDVTMSILKLHDKGKLYNWEEKWWRNTKCPNSYRDAKEIVTFPLTIDKFAGVFIVLISGIFFSMVVGIGQYIYQRFIERRIHQKKKGEKISSNSTAPEKVVLRSHVIFETLDGDPLGNTGPVQTNIF